MTCECGVVVKGGAWHLAQHQKTRAHQTRLAAVPSNPLAPLAALQLVDPPQEAPRTTLRRMADVLRGKHPEPTTPTEAFDGAYLNLGDEPSPVWPRNPIPVGDGPRPGRPKARAGRPPGAEDLTPLFATGLVILTSFAVGDWAAPTADEANAIAVPLSNIMARRIDLAAKLGRDASDTIALVVAVLAYSYRIVPLATERVRGSLDQRRTERVSRAGSERAASDAAYGAGTDGVVARSGNGQGAYDGSALDPFHALAQARTVGRGVLDRSLGRPSNDDPTVADR